MLTWAFGLVLVIGLAVTAFAIHRHRQKEKAANRERWLADFQLVDRTGRPVSRAELAGLDLVVNFVFSSCSVSCLQVNEHLAQVQRLLAEQSRDDVRLVSITVDPRTDTPPVLAEFARRFGADTHRWLFLTGEPAAVETLISTSFLDRAEPAYGDTMPGGFAGTGNIAIVDRRGRVRTFVDGLNDSAPRRVMEELAKLEPAPKHAHSTTGLVREIAPDRRSAVIRHEEIPGYMPRMTMELTVRRTNELAGISPGDTIAFRLLATDETHWIEELRRLSGPGSNAAPTEAGTPAAADGAAPGAPAGSARPPPLKPGDLLPEAHFTDEDGRTFALTEFRGRAVAFTFFFTRCPLPDFCPRMNQNFAEARKLLADTAPSATNWVLLSISFDPEFDRPAVLKTHARRYRGEDPGRWLFAVADAPTLRDLAPRLDLRMAREAGSISHNLRTVVLDTTGRIHRQFDGNRWTAADLATALTEAARRPSP